MFTDVTSSTIFCTPTAELAPLPCSTLRVIVGQLMKHPLRMAVFVVVTTAAAAEAGQRDAQDLKRLTIEQLMEIDVVLARRPEPVRATAAAVSVITRDDIRRSGVTTIADALLLADGVHVARFNNGTRAITARGFNQNSATGVSRVRSGRVRAEAGHGLRDRRAENRTQRLRRGGVAA